jgi:2-C-methyl-D-erythritol 4-phosphate cytidylyltransferase
MTERVGAVILAAGSGRRMVAKVNKPYLPLGGKPLLYYSFKRFSENPAIDELVAVVREEDRKRLQSDLLDAYRFRLSIRVAIGGPERQDSALAGLEALSKKTDLVLVHDGVRPFFSQELIDCLIDAARTHRAALPGLPVRETIREVNKQSMAGPPLDQQRLIITQTPQCYEYALLSDALQRATDVGRYFTDEAGAVLAMMGISASIVPGERRNIKITTAEDLTLAAQLLVRE